MRTKIRLSVSPFVKDVFYTSISSIVTILCLILTIKIISNSVEAEEFSMYLLARRIITVIDPVATFAMGFALTRYTAISLNDTKGHSYLSSAILIVFFITVAILILGLSLDNEISKIIFNSSDYISLLHAIFLLIAGYTMYIVLYSHLRGLGLMSIANTWQLSVIAIGPLIVSWQVLRTGGGIELIIYGMAALCFLSVPFIFNYLKIYKKFGGHFYRKDKLKELIVYASPRVPGAFSYNLIFAVGPFIAAYQGLLKESGFIVIGQFVLRIIEGGVEGFSRVAFPRLSKDFSIFGKKGLTKNVSNLTVMIFHVGLYLTAHLFIWNKLIIVYWLGYEYIDVLIPLQIITLSILPFLLFAILRNVLDSSDVRPIVSNYLHFILFITILLSILSIWLKLGVNGLTASFVLGIFLLGLMTFKRITKDYLINKSSFCFIKIVALNILILIIFMLIKASFKNFTTDSITILILLVFEILFFIFYLYCINKMKSDWIKLIINRLINLKKYN
jgi:O-antigen/teichoic acid export membrane protein